MFAGQKISGSKARKLVESGALLFDTRDPVSFRNGSLPNAKNLPLRQVSTLLKHPKNTKMVFFGDSNTDSDLMSIVNYAIQYGFTQVYTMGSIHNWTSDSR